MNSLACLSAGFRIIFRKGIKRYSLGPLLINLILYALIGSYLFQKVSEFITWGIAFLPGWLSFLEPVAWVIFGIFGLLLIGYTFAIVALIVSAPFSGLLAEKVAAELGYRSFDEKLTWAVVRKIIVRSIQREGIKLLYNLPRIIGVLLLALILNFIPLINLLVPVITFLWASWSIAIQFIDYPADNDQIEFRPMLDAMRKKRSQCLWFGAGTAFLLSIPLVNVLTIPAAVAGGTKLWLEEIDSGIIKEQQQ